MRKLLISLLLASAAMTPALADPDHKDHQNAKAERSEARAQSHADRSERSAPVERPQVAGQGHVNGAMGNGGGQGRFNGAVGLGQGQSGHVQGGQVNAVEAPAQGPRVINNNGFNGRNWRGGDRRQIESRNEQVIEQGQQIHTGPHVVTNDTLRQPDRPPPNVMRTHTRTPVVSDVPRPGTQPPLRRDIRRTADVHWNTNWRNDGHHDWHNWRNRHHSWFHLGFYYDPFGWGYQPYSIGWRMWPAYYGSSFWINDPWQYRLPYAPPGTQWVRYYNDAVLVDTWTGEVLDVVYNFFW